MVRAERGRVAAVWAPGANASGSGCRAAGAITVRREPLARRTRVALPPPPGHMTVRCMHVGMRATRALTGLAGVVSLSVVTGCGSGDSTVAKTPQATTTTATAWITAPPTSGAAAPGPGAAPPDPCAVNLASPTIAKVVSELPRDPRSRQPWNPEPLAGNYNECAQLSAVIIKANTNTVSPSTRAVLFHLGQLIPQGVPDTYGFNGIDTSQTTGDTVALTYPSGINGLTTNVRVDWNGNAVELSATPPGTEHAGRATRDIDAGVGLGEDSAAHVQRQRNRPGPPVTTITQRPSTGRLTSTSKNANPISPPAAAWGSWYPTIMARHRSAA